MLYIVSTLLFVFSAVQGRLVMKDFENLTPFERLMNMAIPKIADKKECVASGQCYIGKTPEKECCGGHAVTDLTCSESAVCSMCELVVPRLISLLVNQGCAAVIPEGVALCEVIGLGPEDPLADICAGLVAASCIPVSMMVAKGVTNALDICTDLSFCGESSSIFGQRCDCVQSGHCTFYEAGCCSGDSDYDWQCVPPLSKCK